VICERDPERIIVGEILDSFCWQIGIERDMAAIEPKYNSCSVDGLDAGSQDPKRH
jgi:hypothetical protein